MTLVRPPEFTCRTTVDHGLAVVSVTGELDLSTATGLTEALAPLLDMNLRAVTIDLAGLEFIDSTGLTLIVRTSKALRQHGGELRLTSPTPPVRRILELVGLDSLLVA
jgi:anti-sigma B factor antagonist